MQLVSRSRYHTLRWLPLMAALASTSAIHAHHLPPGIEEVDEFATQGVVSSIIHPFTGMDHILVAAAVGWMAWSMGRRAGGFLLAAFLASMMAGLSAWYAVGARILDGGVALSMAATGFLLVPLVSKATAIRFAAVLAAGLIQGLAHTGGAPLQSAAMLGATGGLCGIGMAAASWSMRTVPGSVRWASAALVVFGAAQWFLS